MSETPFLSALISVLSPQQVWTHPSHADRMQAYEQDWRKREHGKALAVVFPRTTTQLQAIVRLCLESGVSIVPQGGNTGLVLGSTPNSMGQQLVVSTQRMNRVLSIDADNMTLTAESGCILAHIQQAARDQGLWFPLSMASEGSCTIGGNLATNAGGTQVLQFGTARQLCLGIEAVMPDGSVMNVLRGLRKDNTGFDMRDLLIGSEGTLGIITKAVLKLWPQPKAQIAAWLGVQHFDDACHLLRLAREHMGARLTGFEVMNPLAIALVQQHVPHLKQPLPQHSGWHVLLELTDSQSLENLSADTQALIQSCLDSHLIQDGVQAQSFQQTQQLWHIRESIPLAQATEGLNIKHDISLPISHMSSFVRTVESDLQKLIPNVRTVNFGHLGDGNLHFNVQAPLGIAPADFLDQYEDAVHELVFACVEKHSGSISAEHGIGRLKQQRLQQHQDPSALHQMRLIKQALDPHGLFNPGVILSSPDTMER